MRFKCGECSKLYRLAEGKIPAEGFTLPCNHCENTFTIKPTRAFYSESRNSEVVCENCGRYIKESQKKCPHCNLILNKAHEELRIDNNYYEALDQVEAEEPQQQIDPQVVRGAGRGKTVFFTASAAGLLLILLMGGFTWLAISTDAVHPAISSPLKKLLAPEANEIHTQVVIMNSGATYYVKEIARDGDTLHLTHLNGINTTVKEAEILSISTAIIEQK